ncbi:hypothetical protein Q4578_16865 [Shimia thalassica]|uniref:hypothetical protein n=1 Tax=Shimia thalassica TaxID=1715693 RepID=UPI0026E481B3|nr:hypothetical protein [Shimia thalassica]MDO6523271.1 hypothetical protein [Shimia thalassica]
MRDIHADTYAALQVDGFHPVMLVHIDWPDGAVRAHTGGGAISWGGETWSGVGDFGGADIPDEVSGTAVPAEMTLSLLGDLDRIFAEMDQPARNRDVDVYFGLVTERQGNVLIGEPVPLMIGYVDSNEMDYREVDEGVTVPAFTLGVNSGPSVRTALSASHSSEDQQATFATDTIFRHTVYNETDKVNPPIFP